MSGFIDSGQAVWAGPTPKTHRPLGPYVATKQSQID